MSHKGWNDPPKVSYDSFQQATGKKSLLTKRPDYTMEQLACTAGQQASSSVPLTKPPRSNVTSKPAVHDVAEKKEEQIKDIDTLRESLKLTITRYEKHMQKRVVDDVYKRLDSFVEHWKNGKLSKPVKASMTSLVDALATDDYTEADEIHIKLMVDHIGEVSQWMIGIKKLILAVRTNS